MVRVQTSLFHRRPTIPFSADSAVFYWRVRVFDWRNLTAGRVRPAHRSSQLVENEPFRYRHCGDPISHR